MAQDDVATWVPPQEPTWRRIARIGFWSLIGLAVLLLVVSIVFLFLVTRVYSVSTPTMEHTVPAGDRVFLAPGSALRRGDVVVLRVPVSVSHSTTVFVKRVIGLPGDHVACCDSRGRVTVNGRPLDETYLYPGDPPSRSTFSVTLGPGRIWVMGDQRTISADSRTWGPVPLSGVVGRVALVNHGFSFTALHTPQTFVADGLAPADTRADDYQVLAFLIAGSLLALLVLALTGITRYLIGERGSPHGPPRPSAKATAPDESAPADPAPAATAPAPAPAAAASSVSASAAPASSAPAAVAASAQTAPAPSATAVPAPPPSVPAPAAPAAPSTPAAPVPSVPAPDAPIAQSTPAAPAPSVPAPAVSAPSAPAPAVSAPSAPAADAPAVPSTPAAPAPSAPAAPSAPPPEGLADA